MIDSSRADTIIVTAIGDAADSFSQLITRHPTLPILRADLNANTVQVITSQQVSANVPDLLTALTNLSKRSDTMTQLTRRDFLKLSGIAALGVAADDLHLHLLDPIGIDNPLASHPERDWEKKPIAINIVTTRPSLTSARPTIRTLAACAPLFATESFCDLRRTTTWTRYSDLYGNKATAHWHPRGCKKGQTFHRRMYGPHRLKGPLMRKGWKQWADDGFPLLNTANKSKI